MWIPLSEALPGTVFETMDGTRAIKTEYHRDNGACECYLLGSGEAAHFAQHIQDSRERARAHNATKVRPCAVLSSCQPVRGDAEPVAALRERIVETERLALDCLHLGDLDRYYSRDAEVDRLRREVWSLRHKG